MTEQDKLGEAIVKMDILARSHDRDMFEAVLPAVKAAKAYHQIKPLLKLMGKNRSNYANLLKLETKISEIMKGGE